eukprot:gnl/TRDRNA2_/TRDRNA2_176674_c0_seq2.p1 gnl/TRDRNA2_/TRDRNA2_176674_c0~~gnl/TRDRNA2_/TRDRNA2_176674_c0_seq2.p1  ORF type:complete len:108 (-),score=9.33 gnl/TRDRNA2_/TRDRNA2_176674_c0_seq2:348-671(-)
MSEAMLDLSCIEAILTLRPGCMFNLLHAVHPGDLCPWGRFHAAHRGVFCHWVRDGLHFLYAARKANLIPCSWRLVLLLQSWMEAAASVVEAAASVVDGWQTLHSRFP